MPVRIRNRRGDPRSRIPGFQDAEIAFKTADGVEHRFPLVELSVQGGSFRLANKMPDLKIGTVIDAAQIRVGEITIQANLEVLHVSRIEGSAYVCGTRLYPVSEENHNELTSLVSRLENLPE